MLFADLPLRTLPSASSVVPLFPVRLPPSSQRPIGILAGSTIRIEAFHFFACPIPACFSHSVADSGLPCPLHWLHWHSILNSLTKKVALTPLQTTSTRSGRLMMSSTLKCWLQCDARRSILGRQPASAASASLPTNGFPSKLYSFPVFGSFVTPPPMSILPFSSNSSLSASAPCGLTLTALTAFCFTAEDTGVFDLGLWLVGSTSSTARPLCSSCCLYLRNLTVSFAASCSYLVRSSLDTSLQA